MSQLLQSWVTAANAPDAPFPLNNLPYGVFRADHGLHCGVAIGDMILDVTRLEQQGLLSLPEELVFATGTWNDFMRLGPKIWAEFRAFLTHALAYGSALEPTFSPHLVPQAGAEMALPLQVAEFTDFYANRHHATNVGTMFRGAENALPPNWLHIPIGYNGRASSVVVSGTDVQRPWGQIKDPTDEKPSFLPSFLPSARFDFELEMGAIIGQPSHGPVTLDAADAMIFGYVLLNDWSARDIQAWEYQPLGPFQAKATATSISPWIVTAAALAPFRVSTPAREVALLDHLKDTGPMLYDIDLTVTLAPHGQPATIITRTNYREMYYSAAQQLTHHASSGCPMNIGDLLGSGTISGADKGSRGALLELSWGGKEPLTLDSGETRAFLEDGDTLTLHGAAQGDGFQIGFGVCTGILKPAAKKPFAR